MEEKGVVGSGSFDQPEHPFNDVLACRLVLRVSLVVSQDDHVTLVEASAHDQVLDILDVVDAASQLSSLAKVVDPDQKRLLCPPTVAE